LDETVRFPKVYAALKWGIVGTLTVLAILAAIFWTLVLGGFAGGGFHAAKTKTIQNVVVTPECAWPYKVNDTDAVAVCRMFYNLTSEQRAEVLRKRAK
jgi:hypothetical protein